MISFNTDWSFIHRRNPKENSLRRRTVESTFDWTIRRKNAISSPTRGNTNVRSFNPERIKHSKSISLRRPMRSRENSPSVMSTKTRWQPDGNSTKWETEGEGPREKGRTLSLSERLFWSMCKVEKKRPFDATKISLQTMATFEQNKPSKQRRRKKNSPTRKVSRPVNWETWCSPSPSSRNTTQWNDPNCTGPITTEERSRASVSASEERRCTSISTTEERSCAS